MLSRTTIFVLAGLLHASANVGSIQQYAAYERVMKCLDDVSIAIDKLVRKVKDDPNKGLKVICRYDEVFRSCLTEDFDSTAGSTGVLDFFRAFYLMRALVLVGCTDVNLEDLRHLVHESGIMDEEGLANIEEDPFSSCAHEVILKCLLFLVGIWENVWAEHVDRLSLHLILFACIENEAKTCKEPMMKHIVDYVKAFKNHLWKDDALLARMMSEDKQHEKPKYLQ